MRGKQHNLNDDTRAEVHLMTSRGATQSMAADALGIEEKCLRRHYRGELDGGAVQADIAVAGNLSGILGSVNQFQVEGEFDGRVCFVMRRP